ncbi:1-phosphofructokinase family hexose kinase [Flavimaricola marinus]|uniref:Phosphofructokinase n=1 Tax=Flavimaricola marinus TaxID=1819565 RepID=A0A238LGY1_9RHOB|nr:1-phosphofructokinase family hexose kinase [Flavimaricola marinus]SMY08803.1 6-phosphofructokinase isozyme 2 [Flavimaricola marinus]
MRDILTVTLNPALDLASEAPRVIPNEKLRCDPAHTDPGGGGINVSRAIQLLGGSSRCFVALGGSTGQRIADLLGEAGLDLIQHKVPGETRTSLAVGDKTTGDQYRFMLPGPPWFPADVAAVEAGVLAAAEPGGLAVLSGSLPLGAPPALMADLAARLTGLGAEVIVDTSGPALHQLTRASEFAPKVLRMNHFEAQDCAGHPLNSLQESADFAAALAKSGAAQIVIVARGPEGSVLATPTERWHSRAANVPVRSKVGAGDSFVGGFTYALAQGLSLPECLTRGVAAGSAAVMTEGTLLCRPEDAERLIAHCPSTRL